MAEGLPAAAVPDAEFRAQDAWSPGFPSARDVAAAAAAFRQPPPWLARYAGPRRTPLAPEGPRPRITIGPGVIVLSRPDLAKAERTAERQAEAHLKDVAVIAAYIAEHGEPPPDALPSRVITGWSAKSRANMIKTLAMLDYGPLVAAGRVPAMLTLTYPSEWRTAAPDGQAVKHHLHVFRKRYERAWGEPLAAVWKLEFQHRGAPHFHLYLIPPYGRAGDWRAGMNARHRRSAGDGLAFRQWVSGVWADVVAHPDPDERELHRQAGTNVEFDEGIRCSDPRRLAVYFSKHGQFRAKDYQNDVPGEWQEPGRGPGRFWGYWHLEKAVASAELSPEDYITVTRVMRRYARSRQLLREPRVPRSRRGEVNPALIRNVYPDVLGLAGLQLQAGTVRRRKVRRRARSLKHGAGFVCVKDGPLLALRLAQLLTSLERKFRPSDSLRSGGARSAYLQVSCTGSGSEIRSQMLYPLSYERLV